MGRLRIRCVAGLVGWLACSSAMAQAPAPDGWTRELQLEHGAYQVRGAPNVVVHAPPGYVAGDRVHLVVFLHGFNGCARVLMGEGQVACRKGGRARSGWQLAKHHDSAGTRTLLVIPQLAFLKRESHPGCFARSGCFRRFVQALLRELGPAATQARGLDGLDGVTLVAHSAGYHAALTILQRGGLEAHIRNVVLLDALYAGTAGFARWAAAPGAAGRRLISLYHGAGKTRAQSRRLYRTLRRKLGGKEVARASAQTWLDAAGKHRVVVASLPTPHGRFPERHLGELLRALDLPQRRASASE